MENGFLAKSTGETIIEHTENLIENFILLMKLYPNIKVNKKLLLLACIYHDLGKINKKFQGKLFGKRDESEIPHGVLSTAFINSKNLIKNQNFDKYDLKILAHAVALHHERDISEIEDDDFEKEIELMNNETENFINSLKKLEKEYKDYFGKDNDELVEKSEIFNIKDNNIKLKKLSERYYKLGERLYSVDVSMSKEEAEEIFSKYIMLKGLLNKIDYAASSGLKVEYKNNFLEKSMENFLQNILKKYNSNNNWNDLQKFMIKNRDKNVIVVAQTGFGKTEAGLLWIGNNKGFFTLPLRVAINSIYKRIEEQIIQGDVTNKFGILHSDFRSEYLKNLENNKKDKNIQKNMTEDKFDEYINKTKQLSLPLTVCTIDQLFDFVYRAAGFELKVAILSYSKIVIDEIQMYSSELVASLIFGIKYITDFGGKFAIMTATLPGVIKTLLEKENIPFITTEPFINNDIRHKVKVENKEINAEFIKEKYKNNKILVVCNTVRKSKEIYNKLKEMGIPDDEINLLHSQFIKKDRTEKEAEISKFADPKRFTDNIKKERQIENIRENGIWIGTQILEASLDLDFDVLITELSDLNGLFQRMGRCYRKRIIRIDEEYNCYVFIENCSGIGSKKSIIDETIHEKSREKLVNIDGILTEKEKLSLIDDVYSYESLKESKYFQLINEKLYTLKDYIVEYDIKKEEVRKIFRNIRSIEIIPKRVYDDNAEMINEKIEILKRTYKDLSQEEKEKLKLEKIKARDKINQLKVNIPEYEFDKSDYEFLKINNYESIIILNCDYSYERGVEILKQEKKKDFEDLCF